MDFSAVPDFLLGKSGIIVAFLAAIFVLERLFPVAFFLGGLARIGRNLGLAAFNIVLSPLIVIPVSQLAGAYAFNWRPDGWTGPLALVLDLLILDVWIYWWHRANHEFPFLWRFHEVHHLDETLDSTSALRFHFGEVILSSLVRAGVIIALDMPLQSILVFELLVALSAIFHHSNLRLPHWLEHPLSFVIVTPSIHWVHHHAIRRDTDSNYATILSFWDRLFASRSLTRRTPELTIGVEGRRDVNLPRLAARPFTPDRDRG